VRLRRAPSLVVGPRALLWIAPSDADPAAFATEQQAERDDALDAVVAISSSWAPWPEVRNAILRAAAADDEQAADLSDELDEWLLTLLDAGLLHADVVPPLVGPEPGPWLQARLASLPAARSVAANLTAALNAAAQGDVAAAEVALARLPGSAATGARTPPGASSHRAVRGDLLFHRGASVTLSRAALERAAALAPLLFAIQEALAPPGAERTPGPALAGALEAATETFGAGALDLGALALGDYGAAPGGSDSEEEAAASPGTPAQALLRVLTEGIVEAARERRGELALASDELLDLVGETIPPPTAELFVTPTRARPGHPPGQGWLLGLHAPAGASWGRFGAALGDEGASLLEALATAEQVARPGEHALDVAFAPSAAHADLCTHPAVRDRVLALSGWADPAGGQSEVTLAELELVADPSALEPLALRTARLGPVAPTPLHRVRSHTAPPGVWRLLAGWSLRRQHAPWALAWGPLAGLAALPRVSIDGFVVAPATWRVPVDVARGTASSRSIRAWRRARGIPRYVQVGHEDELLPVDLEAPAARADLRGAARVHEIWPPLGDTPDRAGRRVEAVVAIARVPEDAERVFTAAAVQATAAAGQVPPPRATAAAPEATEAGWTTFKLFGAEDRQNDVLLEVVATALAAARTEGAALGWFFQRYLDGPGHRPHLRVRVSGDGNAFARHLDGAAKDARTAGDVVAVERGPYFPETGRLGGAGASAAVHTLFEAASELALSLIDSSDSSPPEPLSPAASPERPGADLAPEMMGALWLVAAFDRLARAFGLDGDQRRQLAARRRAAHADLMSADLEAELGRELRVCRPALRRLLAGTESARAPAPTADESGAEGALARYAQVARKAVAALPGPDRDRLLPALLHLDAVRLLGADRVAEIRAYVLWERGLESLAHHPAKHEKEGPRSSGHPRPHGRTEGPTRPGKSGSSGSPSQRTVNPPHRSRH